MVTHGLTLTGLRRDFLEPRPGLLGAFLEIADTLDTVVVLGDSARDRSSASPRYVDEREQRLAARRIGRHTLLYWLGKRLSHERRTLAEGRDCMMGW